MSSASAGQITSAAPRFVPKPKGMSRQVHDHRVYLWHLVCVCVCVCVCVTTATSLLLASMKLYNTRAVASILHCDTLQSHESAASCHRGNIVRYWDSAMWWMSCDHFPDQLPVPCRLTERWWQTRERVPPSAQPTLHTDAPLLRTAAHVHANAAWLGADNSCNSCCLLLANR